MSVCISRNFLYMPNRREEIASRIILGNCKGCCLMYQFILFCLHLHIVYSLFAVPSS